MRRTEHGNEFRVNREVKKRRRTRVVSLIGGIVRAGRLDLPLWRVVAHLHTIHCVSLSQKAWLGVVRIHINIHRLLIGSSLASVNLVLTLAAFTLELQC